MPQVRYRIVAGAVAMAMAAVWFTYEVGKEDQSLSAHPLFSVAEIYSLSLTQRTQNSLTPKLLPRLAGKRFVYLAEPDHYISEKYDFLLAFVQELLTQGFRNIGFEMSYSDGLLLDKYLASGDERYLNLMWSLGYRGEDMDLGDRTSRPKMFRLQSYDWLKDLQTERRWFFRQLYRLSTQVESGERLKAFGFDLQVIDPEVVYGSLYRLLEPARDNPVISSLKSNLQRIPGQSLAEEVERLQWLKRALTEDADIFASQLGPKFEEFRHLVAFLIESLGMFQQAEAATTTRTVYGYLKRREQMMISRLHQVLRDNERQEKVILSGHIMHLSKDDRELWFPSAKRPRAKPIWWTLGTELANLYPEEVLSLWMLYDQGRHSDPQCQKAACEVSSEVGTLEHDLGKTQREALLLIPQQLTEDNKVATEVRFKVNGTTVLKSRLAGQVDMIYFRRDVSEPNPNR